MATPDARTSGRVEIAFGLLAFVLIGTVLALVVGHSPFAPARMDPASILAIAIVAGALTVAAAVIVLRFRSITSRYRQLSDEAAHLRKSLLAAEVVLKAEPQVLVFWAQGQGPEIITHNLTAVSGLPESTRELLHFGNWLDVQSANDLKSALEGLFSTGHQFSVLLKTSAGGNVEADGRTAGGRAILKLRDVVGQRRDLARILDQHRHLARDIRASRALLNALPMPVWLRAPDGQLEWVNNAYAKAVEVSDPAQAREHQAEFLEKRQRKAMAAGLAKDPVYRERAPVIIAGERRAHDVIAIQVDGTSVAIAIDVAAVETAKGELDRQIAAYDRTLHRVATPVAIFGPDKRLAFFNEAYLKLWQLDEKWLQTHPHDGEILDRLRELNRLPEAVNFRDWKAKLLSAYRTGTPQEDWWHLPDGRAILVIAEQRPDGGVTYLYDDATERFAMESRYNALIDVQSETLDNLKEGVAVFGTDGRLKLFNSAFAQIWKLSPEVLNEDPHIEEVIRQCLVLYDDLTVWTRLNRTVTAFSDNRRPIEGQMARPDSSVIDYAVLPLPDAATLITFADVTAAKHYERALLERNEALVAADRLKGQFVSHVSYALRTPLTSIIGFSELLGRPITGDLNTKQREYLNVIHGESSALLALINDILDLATIDAGAMELKLGPVEARDIIAAASLGMRDRLNRARLNLDVTIPDDGVSFIADESRVRQVLYNLLANAAGFSKQGGTIRLICDKKDDVISFTIEDEGLGIPKDKQSKVLERFETDAQGSRHRGAGLGLAIVKSLVELHGGDLMLSSEPGQGTRVTVSFPQSGSALQTGAQYDATQTQARGVG